MSAWQIVGMAIGFGALGFFLALGLVEWALRKVTFRPFK